MPLTRWAFSHITFFAIIIWRGLPVSFSREKEQMKMPRYYIKPLSFEKQNVYYNELQRTFLKGHECLYHI